LPSSLLRVALASVAIALSALPGCSCSSGILLAVDVRTDLVSGVEFDEVEIQLDESPATRVDAAVGDPFDRGRRVLETEGLELGRHDLEVTLLSGGTRVVGRSYVIRLDGNLVVLAVLTRDCRGVSCPGAGDSAAATECLGGTCVDPECGALGSDECVSECSEDDDCSSTTSCVRPVCVSGVCLEGSAPTSCPAGEYCQPGAGCLPIPVAGDGSVVRIDAGSCEGEADCDDGFSCTIDRCVSTRCESTPNDAACTTGVGPRCAPSDGAADATTGCVSGACSAATCVAGPCENAECFDDACVRSARCADSEMCCSGTCAASCSAVPCAGQPAGTGCRAAAGGCDVEEVCDGSSPTCPVDTFAPGGVCRAAAGTCDVAESCSGGSADCPMDAFVSLGTGCSVGFCDGMGVCSSTCTPGADCPTASPCSIGTVSCSSGSPVCGAPFRPASAGTPCRDAAGMCDVAEVCDGSSTSCPTNAFASSGACRGSAGGCDVAESCNGSGPNCPSDTLRGAGLVCRGDSGGGCDVAEVCSGSSPDCPANGFRSGGVVCRADSGAACDLPEVCSGGSGTCPANATNPLGNYAETCCSTSIDPCRAGECLAGTCAAFGGAFAVQGESSDECVPNPITGTCTCPAGFIDQVLVDMDGNVDEGTGWESYLHVCRTPSAVTGADFRGASSELTGLPTGVGCGSSCTSSNPYTGGCSCPVSTADDDFDGVHYQGGTPLDCQRSISMCRSLPTSPLTYGGTYRVMTDTGVVCNEMPAGAQCEPNTITGGCSCPSGFAPMTYNAMMRHTDQVTYPNGFCRATMTVCVRSP